MAKEVGATGMSKRLLYTSNRAFAYLGERLQCFIRSLFCSLKNSRSPPNRISEWHKRTSDSESWRTPCLLSEQPKRWPTAPTKPFKRKLTRCCSFRRHRARRKKIVGKSLRHPWRTPKDDVTTSFRGACSLEWLSYGNGFMSLREACRNGMCSHDSVPCCKSRVGTFNKFFSWRRQEQTPCLERSLLPSFFLSTCTTIEWKVKTCALRRLWTMKSGKLWV